MIYRDKWKDANRIINLIVCLIAGVALMLFAGDLKEKSDSKTTINQNVKSYPDYSVGDSAIVNDSPVLIPAPTKSIKFAKSTVDTDRARD